MTRGGGQRLVPRFPVVKADGFCPAGLVVPTLAEAADKLNPLGRESTPSTLVGPRNPWVIQPFRVQGIFPIRAATLGGLPSVPARDILNQ